MCKKNGLNVILGDIQKNVLKTINKKFDAISAIGPVEHFSSVSEPEHKRYDTLKKYYNQVKNLIDPNSSSRRYLNSYMTMNTNYSGYQSFDYFFHIYFIASTYGYGFYASDEKISSIYNSNKSKIVIKRDYTEDYRWIVARSTEANPHPGICKYKLDSYEKNAIKKR